jgi:ribosomal subunit interface protein
MREALVVISFKDMNADERVRESVEKRCHHLADEFPEVTRFEITLSPDGSGHSAHGHVHSGNHEVATHADAALAGQAADQLLDKLERQLRKVHDKRIFQPRRDARHDHPKRSGR